MSLAERIASVDSSTAEPAVPIEHCLPMLRRDLQLLPATQQGKSVPHWTLYDPVRAKYFRIGWVEFELLSRWRDLPASRIIESVNEETTLRVSQTHVDSLLTMLADNELLMVSGADDINRLLAHSEQRKVSTTRKLFSLSLYYRKPLVNPDKALDLIETLVRPLFHHKVLVGWVVFLLALFAGFGIAAHSFEFKDNFTLFASGGGMLLFAFVLTFTNIIHEIGHGVVAKHFGCSVRQMGLALIFLLPVCYCDTTDAWKLKSRRERLWINAGGILVESVVAIIAALVWLVAPEGIVKTLAFFLTVTSLFTTLLVNLNPFLKFDGYYLLADYLQVDNFQLKSFKSLQWQMRCWLVGQTEKKPFQLSGAEHKKLCLYAVCTWIYRFFLYQIIAWMVYQFWFKALGLVLVAGIVSMMIVKPVLQEIYFYAGTVKRNGITYKAVRSFLVVGVLMGIFLLPLPRMVSAPAVLSSSNVQSFYAPGAVRVGSIHVETGDEVIVGDLLIQLENPDLEYEHQKIQKEVILLQRQQALQTDWVVSADDQYIGQQDITSRVAALNDLTQQINQLTITASGNGRVVSVPEWLEPGVWIQKNQVLAEVVSQEYTEIRAYVNARNIKRIEGLQGTFYQSNGDRIVKPVVDSVSSESISELYDKPLAIEHGGDIAAKHGSDGKLMPLQDLHLVSMTAPVTMAVDREKTGYVLFESRPRSIAASVGNRIYGVMIRESGF